MSAKKSRVKTTRKITIGRYRTKRAYLADHCFGVVPSGERKPKEKELLGRKKWAHLMNVPTDVLLRTTDYLGPMVDDMLTQSAAWLRALPIGPSSMPFMFEPAINTYDEFEAAPFLTVHGWYRQATAALRNALEVMTHAARYAVQTDTAGYESWRAALVEPKFGNSVEIIGAAPSVALVETTLGGSGLFGNKPNGVLRNLYADVCRYAHSAPGFTNPDLWSSNGPVFVGKRFTQFWLDYCDTLMACYVLLKIGYPALELPKGMNSAPVNAGPSWNGLASKTIAAYFP